MPAVFHIDNLLCSYGEGLPVILRIDNLEVRQGELLFLLGASGSGKSTLLETLGLMNNTVRSGEVSFMPDSESGLKYTSLWKNFRRIAEVRKRYFNFIFQNTNLMENFTAYENVCLAGMIKGGKSQDEMLGEVRQIMERVGLTEKEVGLKTLALNLSGGQRQRLAFVRALCSESTVLLCDEPTGNLDEANANELFEVIRENLKGNRTAVVVSHDIDLALKYADRIVLLTKDVEKGYGEVLSENIFNREKWMHLTHSELETFKEEIKSTFITKEHLIKRESGDNENHALSGTFRSIFFRRESAALSGKKRANFLLLCGIFLFSFIAIGFGNGSLDYLKAKLSSAFVKWLTITIPYLRVEDWSKSMGELNDRALRDHYGYDSVTAYSISSIYIYNPLKKDSSFPKGRTFNFDFDRQFLKEEVFSKSNLIKGYPFEGDKDLSLILTPEFLSTNGYTSDSNFVELCFEVTSTDSAERKYRHIPVPVRAIVKELPGKSSYACMEYFDKAYLMNSNSPFDVATHSDKIDYYISTDDTSIAFAVYRAAARFMNDSGFVQKYEPNPPERPSKYTASFGSGYELHLSFFHEPPAFKSLDTISAMFLSRAELKDYLPRIRRIYSSNYVDEASMNKADYDMLSVYINDLDSVRAFANFIYTEFNNADQIKQDNTIEADMSRIKDKENYNFLSSIARIISYLVIIFGSVAVSLFIFNLLRMHLNKVKMNIGTFMAIGLDNKQTRKIYFSIISLFIVGGIAASFCFALLFGAIINYFVNRYSGVEQGNYFNMFNWNTLIAIGIFLLSSMLVSWFTINRILSKSPGDLIYNR